MWFHAHKSYYKSTNENRLNITTHSVNRKRFFYLFKCNNNKNIFLQHLFIWNKSSLSFVDVAVLYVNKMCFFFFLIFSDSTMSDWEDDVSIKFEFEFLEIFRVFFPNNFNYRFITKFVRMLFFIYLATSKNVYEEGSCWWRLGNTKTSGQENQWRWWLEWCAQ